MAKNHRFNLKNFRVKEGDAVDLEKWSTKAGPELDNREMGSETLAADNAELLAAQLRLYASGNRSLLIILQGMDAAGKDGVIRHVMHGVNPQGCRVYSFKAPNEEERRHHFLWRPMRFLPEKGMISLFNRSYYEEVMVVRVHPEFLESQRLPPVKKLNDLWKRRYQEIRHMEESLVANGTSVLKFFLHISKKEQKKRLLERLVDKEKRWKFNENDLKERDLWGEHRKAFEEAIAATTSKAAPWFVIPADNKWYARAAIADIIAAHLEGMNLEFPQMPEEEEQQVEKWIEQLKGDG